MNSLALYIHWPFCQSKCPYCDFNSHVRGHIEETTWQEAYKTELKRTRELTGQRSLSSIFFGGGTPSLMSPTLVAHILETANHLWGFESSLEITLEANPTSLEREKFRDLKKAGINRVSIGVQSFNEDDLRFLGRQHSSEDAKRSLHMAQKYFDRVSFDLIYARPSQTVDTWHKELEEALSFDVGHLSLYQLTIEQGTAFSQKYARDEFSLPEESLAVDLYQQTIETLGKKGLEIYEISNFAKEGQKSRHNLAYWMYQDYAGVGPGAHGRVTCKDGTKIATKQFKMPETWLTQVHNNQGTQESIVLSPGEQAKEQLIMGLRLFQPFNLADLALPWQQVLRERNLEVLVRQGFIEQRETFLHLPVASRLCLNEVLRYLVCPLI